MNLSELNPSQIAAVECCDAPSLVIAGAGSGKTRVLTYKIAYLLDKGMEPYHILALTFTNKAAREMKERIGRLVGEEKSRYLWMGTFHSIFSRVLRTEAEILGFSADFTIYDAADSKSLVKAIIKEMGLDDKKYKPSAVCSHISRAKNALVLPAAYASNSTFRRADDAARMPLIHEIYQRYSQRCRQANAMDFDDLLLYTWVLFENHPEVASKYQERFQFILVDEYQDTNYAQHRIVWQLSNVRQRVCVVGDDAQSIYSFRGADIDNILNFQSTYQGTRLFKLEQNYRSSQMIVGAANSLISHNSRQIHKDVFSKGEVGSPVEIFSSYSDVDEANIVLKKIQQLVRSNHLTYSQVAILYRTNAQSRSFEEVLRKSGLPYRIYGGLSFYQRKEIKDAVAYFRLAVNPNDEEALRRVVNYPARGIGDTTMKKVFEQVNLQHVSPWEVLSRPDTIGLNKGIQARIQDFVSLISDFHARCDTTDAFTLCLDIITASGLRADIFQGSEVEDKTRQENLQELMDGIASFVQENVEAGNDARLSHYLQEISLLSDLDEDKGENEDKVTLMTVHSAKGLEFDAVFVVGMEENLFPSQMAVDSPSQVEEERRLFYVAMTRAKSHLVITWAKSRFRYGQMEYSSQSRFLREIDGHYTGMATPKRESPSPVARTPLHPGTFQTQRTPAPTPAPPTSGGRFVRLRPASAVSDAPTQTMPQLTTGQRVSHERFGAGTVKAIEGTGMDAKAFVQFDNAGLKKLLLRFVKLKILS